MKSVSAAAVAALLGMSVAQPHGHHGHHHHHAKRDLVTEWETVWETVTVLVDESTTQTILPTHSTSGAPGEFFQPPSSTTSESQPEPTVAQTTPTTTKVPPTTVATTTTTSPPPPPPPPTTTTTTTPPPAPTTTSVQTPPAQTKSSDPPASGGGSSYSGPDGFGTSSMDSAKYSGDITFYTLGLGACGYDDSGADLSKNIVAISHADWYARGSGTSLGLNMPNHPWCDQTITITANGKSTTALVHDICPGCVAGAIDVSESVFEALFGDLGVGRSTASWTFN